VRERRALTFTRLDEVMPDVDRLLAGHQTVGNWSLGQICNHLTAALLGSVEGFDFGVPWFLRLTLGRLAKRQILRSGRVRAGVKLPERALPRPGLDDRAEAEALRAALNHFSGYTGAVADHPFFGRMTKPEWIRLHLIHCAHHLSFVLPVAGN
jgi:hypothetical protein